MGERFRKSKISMWQFLAWGKRQFIEIGSGKKVDVRQSRADALGAPYLFVLVLSPTWCDKPYLLSLLSNIDKLPQKEV